MNTYELSTARAEGNTFYNNSASGTAGGIYVYSHSNTSTAYVTNNLFWLNQGDVVSDLYIENDKHSDYIASPVYVRGNAFDQSVSGYYATLTVTEYDSNRDSMDPQFSSPAENDFVLLETSPFIDKGVDSIQVAVDYKGNPRAVNCTPDVGAVEYLHGLPNPIDSDGDGQNNACDTDDDGDGVLDADDAFPLDSSETVDTDEESLGDAAGGGGAILYILMMYLVVGLKRLRRRKGTPTILLPLSEAERQMVS